MKRISQVITLLILCLSMESVFCQSYQVGIIDYYGTKFSNANIKSCLPFKVNDTIRFLTDSISYVNEKKIIVDCLLEMHDIKQADISFVCCDAEGKVIVFIGTSDKNKIFKNESSKIKDLKLPIEITKAYDSLSNFRLEAIQSGQAVEDNSEGHSLLVHPPSRRIQKRFKVYAKTHLELLQNVIENSKYSDQRAVAVTVIAYYDDKSVIVKDLLVGVLDEDEGVRNDAIRAIGIILRYSNKQPNYNINVSPDPFIKLMNSISWTDRNKSAFILQTMSEQRDEKFLLQLKHHALQALTDMAKWKSDGHALSGYWVLGRIAGWTDKEIQESFTQNKSAMVDKMLTEIK